MLAVLWRSAGLLTLFGLSVYLQIFSTGQNRLSRELGKPFLYLVPEPAFAKLLQCLRALLPSAGMEAVVTFVPVCLLLGLGPGSILACVFSRLTYALLFQSGDLLVERFWSGVNKTLLMVLYLVMNDSGGRVASVITYLALKALVAGGAWLLWRYMLTLKWEKLPARDLDEPQA